MSIADYGRKAISAGKEKLKSEIKKKLLPILLKYVAPVLLVVLIIASALMGGNAGGTSGRGIPVGTGNMPADGDYNVNTKSPEASPVINDITTLKKAFSGYPTNTKLLAEAQSFLDMQTKYNVNAIFAAAVSIVETTAGTNRKLCIRGT